MQFILKTRKPGKFKKNALNKRYGRISDYITGNERKRTTLF